MTQTPEGEKPKEENASTNKESKESKENKDKEKDDSEIKLNRTRRALERIRGRRLEKPPATKRLSQPNILNNPKFALLIQQMGGKLPGMPPLPKKESKEEKEVKIEVVKDNPDDIIMNKPVTSKNNYKKKPSKTVFVDGVEVVEEVSDEDEKNEEKSKKENEKEKENK
jgi:hypothetical protein